MNTVSEIEWMVATVDDAIERLNHVGCNDLVKVRVILKAMVEIKKAVTEINNLGE